MHVAYNCCVYVGATPAISKVNLVNWLDALAIAEAGGRHWLVFSSRNQQKIDGLYQKMKQHQHSSFESKLLVLADLSFECNRNNVSAGMYVSIEPGETGTISLIHKVIGPFR